MRASVGRASEDWCDDTPGGMGRCGSDREEERAAAGPARRLTLLASGSSSSGDSTGRRLEWVVKGWLVSSGRGEGGSWVLGLASSGRAEAHTWVGAGLQFMRCEAGHARRAMGSVRPEMVTAVLGAVRQGAPTWGVDKSPGPGHNVCGRGTGTRLGTAGHGARGDHESRCMGEVCRAMKRPTKLQPKRAAPKKENGRRIKKWVEELQVSGLRGGTRPPAPVAAAVESRWRTAAPPGPHACSGAVQNNGWARLVPGTCSP